MILAPSPQSAAQSRHVVYSVRAELAYLAGAACILLSLFTVARALLLARNRSLLESIPAGEVVESFGVGLRFDLLMTAYTLLPLALSLFFAGGARRRVWWNTWLGALLVVYSVLAMAELDFYREFHTRLNSLVFQYIKEDPKTVLSMLWFGFPIVRYLLVAAALAGLAMFALLRLDRRTRRRGDDAYRVRLVAALIVALLVALAARGTLRQGPPLRWGDAFHGEYLFANHLALNGAYTLSKAAMQEMGDRENPWLSELPPADALALTRSQLQSAQESLTEPEDLPLLRRFEPPAAAASPYRNVVVILMESMSAQRMGAFGNPLQITPHFDALAGQGLLFDHIFSNGTHTHQGMFATLACFPNLPRYEYLMYQPEGAHRFSGLAKVLAARDYDNVYVYNGDFAWDNQYGFFRAQGVNHFVGRHDFVNPRFQDPTWGVSDQDMFDRAFEEITRREQSGKPYYAILQTLSNHVPYALPDPLPVEPVLIDGVEDRHLTAMRYADYALGEFFAKVKASDAFKDTLFVVLGDHGYGGLAQVTELDLVRFHVPLLILGDGIRERFGERRSVVGTQVDVVPTIMGLLGGGYTHHCWGRDLLALPADDPGQGVIKPSGSDQSVAILRGDRILVKPADEPARLYRYQLTPSLHAEPLEDDATKEQMYLQLKAYLQTATQALLSNTTGHGDGPASRTAAR